MLYPHALVKILDGRINKKDSNDTNNKCQDLMNVSTLSDLRSLRVSTSYYPVMADMQCLLRVAMHCVYLKQYDIGNSELHIGMS